jgi:hypothetical protein
MKLTALGGRRQESQDGNRFFTGLDMAIIKKDIEMNNSQARRGEREPVKGNGDIVACGCGSQGCFIFREYSSEELARTGGRGLHDWKRPTKP